MMKTLVRIGVLTALFACAGSVAFASDLIVTKTADTNDGVCDADCSLREAIVVANGEPGDRIILDGDSTYTLSGVLTITGSLTIEGNGATIDGAGLDRVLDIEGNITVVITSVMITGGAAHGFLALGGGVFIRNANVTLNNCTILGNSTAVGDGTRSDGGGIAAIGTFNPGSGVTLATLTLNNTTISGNLGSTGGGLVCVLCQLMTSNAIFSGNTSIGGDGAGIAFMGDASTATIAGGVFTGNGGAARGGAFAAPDGIGSVSITRNRILSNGATTDSGIFNGTATIDATNNWWGCNYGPGAGGAGCAVAADAVSGNVTATPFLVLKTSVSSSTLNPTFSATVTADLTGNSAGMDVSAGGTVPDGIPAAFAGTLGSFADATLPLFAGKAVDTFTAGSVPGAASLSVMIDNQTITSGLSIVLPQVSLDRTSLVFGATSNGTAFLSQTGTQAVHLTQSGLGGVSWTATSDQPWLVVSPASGTGSATLNVSVQFAPGLSASQTGSITLAFTGAGNTAGPIGVTLNALTVSSGPFGSFDTPMDGATGIAGSLPVSGWALDDVEVTGLNVCRDAVLGEPAIPDVRCNYLPKIFVGNAIFVDGARPDVEAAFPNVPLNSRAGWGYLLLTNVLPNSGDGTYTLFAFASDAEGNTTLLGSKTISCANSASIAPFGTIDTPAPGEVVSGSIVANFGWVLAQTPSFADPPDGGIVTVLVDGATVGSPGGWAARPDLTALFPAAQYPGVSHALGVFSLDVGSLSDGLHTIAWVATGTAGGTSGLGSRFFTVSHGALMMDPGTAANATIAAAGDSSVQVDSLPADLSSIAGRRGSDLEAPLQDYLAEDGGVTVRAEELDRIELHLGVPKGDRYVGYTRTPSGLGPLPAGSQLDPSTGVLTWQPGAGFLGTYQFVFVRYHGDVAVARQDVRVVLNPRRGNRVGR